MFEEIITIVWDVKTLWNESKYRECLDILNEAIIQYPGSTELALIKTEILQLTYVDNLYDLEDDIGKPLEEIVKLNSKNLEAYIELAAFEHMVMSNTEKSWLVFEEWLRSIENSLEEFLELYFNFLIENNREDDIVKTKRLLQKTIENTKEIWN